MIGGCLCGTIRYEAQPDVSSAYYCHCRDCQIGSGSAFHVAVLVPQSSFRVLAGKTATYAKTADSGNNIERVFCPNCGTPLWWNGDGFPDVVVLALSSLDNPEAITPSRELWTDSSVSWCRIREGLEKFRGRPEAR
jgi:hypothetical protein